MSLGGCNPDPVTLATLETLPVLCTGHAEDLVIDTGTIRVWRVRVTDADIEQYRANGVDVHTVQVERNDGDGWNYSGAPSADLLIALHNFNREPVKTMRVFANKLTRGMTLAPDSARGISEPSEISYADWHGDSMTAVLMDGRRITYPRSVTVECVDFGGDWE